MSSPDYWNMPDRELGDAWKEIDGVFDYSDDPTGEKIERLNYIEDAILQRIGAPDTASGDEPFWQERIREFALAKYRPGDIVIFRPNWPNQPAFGIWTSDTELVKTGKPFRISKLGGVYSDGQLYYGQFDRDNDGTFNDCHWPARESEILRLAE